MMLFGRITGDRLPAPAVMPAREPGCWGRLIAALLARIEQLVPWGYESESGFHYGRPVVE